MINGTKNSSKTLDSSSSSIELRIEQVQEIDAQGNDFTACEVTHQSVDAQIRLETELILRQVEQLCALSAEQNELNTTGNNEATPADDVIKRVQAPGKPETIWTPSAK